MGDEVLEVGGGGWDGGMGCCRIGEEGGLQGGVIEKGVQVGGGFVFER